MSCTRHIQIILWRKYPVIFSLVRAFTQWGIMNYHHANQSQWQQCKFPTLVHKWSTGWPLLWHVVPSTQLNRLMHLFVVQKLKKLTSKKYVYLCSFFYSTQYLQNIVTWKLIRKKRNSKFWSRLSSFNATLTRFFFAMNQNVSFIVKNLQRINTSLCSSAEPLTAHIYCMVQSYCFHQQCLQQQQTAVLSGKATLCKCSAPNSRQTRLETDWWKKWNIWQLKRFCFSEGKRE